MINTYPKDLTEFQLINIESALARATEKSLNEVEILIQDIKDWREYKAKIEKEMLTDMEAKPKAKK
jgi:flagellar assembly factor FliW